jgi:uridine kinase
MPNLNIIAISGASGSGKSAVIAQLAVLLNCRSLHFDDFIDPDSFPLSMRCWLKDGADPAVIRTPRLVAALQQASAEASSRHDASQFLLLEEPFGRQRPEIAALLDKVVLLKVPQETCLSRVIQRNLAQNSAADARVQIQNYLQRYDDYLQQAYQITVAQVAANCDLIITDLSPCVTIATTISSWLKQQTSD